VTYPPAPDSSRGGPFYERMSSMSEPSEFNDEVQRVTKLVVNLTAMHTALIEAMREVQDVMLFGLHDDLVQLDGELDNVYPEAFE
jgi:hypothetical protein